MQTTYKILFFLAIIFVFFFPGITQRLNIPEHYIFENKEDYRKHEGKIVEIADWMMNTPLPNDQNQRLRANRFLKQWVIGVPYISFLIDGDVVNFGTENKDFVATYMAGYAKFMIENPTASDVRGNLAGVDAVIRLYSISSEKNIEHIKKLIRLKEEKQLVGYLKEQLE